jgi:hypothetical protein
MDYLWEWTADFMKNLLPVLKVLKTTGKNCERERTSGVGFLPILSKVAATLQSRNNAQIELW